MNFHNNHDFITLFEKRLSEFTGAPYVVLVDCCTNALFLCCGLLSVEHVTIPKHTYISVPHMLLNSGVGIEWTDEKWVGYYQLDDYPIYDYAVGLKENIYESGTYMCLSFQQKKAINIGRGGAILLDNKEHYELLKQVAHDGRSDPSKNIKYDSNISMIGFHMYMPPENAAKGVLLLNQLTEKKIEDHIGIWEDYPDLTEIVFK